jgi:hypothetical protein
LHCRKNSYSGVAQLTSSAIYPFLNVRIGWLRFSTCAAGDRHCAPAQLSLTLAATG